MTISSISGADAAVSAAISGVQGANGRLRALGEGLSSLLAVTEQLADEQRLTNTGQTAGSEQIAGAGQIAREAPRANAPQPVDPARGQNVDILV